MMQAGDPIECIGMAHLDGSYSQVRIAVNGDDLDIFLLPSVTHDPRLHGL
jgi:hypothetical protein